jgi:Kef-type K+ transport system membrane component KefB
MRDPAPGGPLRTRCQPCGAVVGGYLWWLRWRLSTEGKPRVEIGIFEQVAGVLAVCVAAGALALLLRQPLIVGLLAAGIAVGPEVLGLVESTSEIELLAKIGISLLLFVVGLKLDVRLVSKLGPVALATGLGQVLFTSLFGFLIAIGLGFDTTPAIYIAVALTFSSTIIIVKLLTDKRELEELHGRIALGFLIVQDIVVVLAMIAITATGAAEGDDLLGEFVGVILRGTLLLAAVAVFGRYIAPRVTHVLARSSELLVLASVTWAVALAAISIFLGFSEEVGAFLAGMSLASTPYREAISGRLTTLRDFLLVFFFIELGTQFELGSALDQLGAAIVFSLFVLIGNPIIVMIIMGLMGYRKRVSFKAGLTVAQISEFSLILVALGVAQGQIGPEVVGLVTAVGLITISASTYLIYGSDRIYERIEPFLRVFERGEPGTNLDLDGDRIEPEYVVVGLGRFGSTVLEELRQRGDEVLGVDFDPRSVQSDAWDVPVIYGDAEDPDLPEQLPLSATRWVISTLRTREANLQLIGSLRGHGYTGGIAVAAEDHDMAEMLEAAGADLTIRPLHIAARPLLALIHERDGGPAVSE